MFSKRLILPQYMEHALLLSVSVLLAKPNLAKPWILRSAVAVSFFYASLAGIGAISESWLSSTSEAVHFSNAYPTRARFRC